MSPKQARFAMYGFAAPFVAGAWFALVVAVWGSPITEEGIRIYGALATLIAPICAVFGATYPGASE